MGKIIFSTSLSKELFQKLESERGMVPRSVYVEFLLNKLLGENYDEARRSNSIQKQEC